MFTKDNLFSLGIYAYIALPFLIFATGFLKVYYALPLLLIILASIYLSAKSSRLAGNISIDKKSIFKIIIGLAFIVAMVLLSGVGNVMWQNNDHSTRNTLFNVLVNHSWPPSYESAKHGEVGLVYYIGFWLPSAVIGQIFSLNAGYIFQIIWTVIGLCILWYLLCRVHNKVVVYPIVVFMFFSGLDILGHSILSLTLDLPLLQQGSWAFPWGTPMGHHMEWWGAFYQYSSHTTQLFWVFNQSLPVWLATVLIILEKNNKNLVFIMGLTLLASTLPFVGLIPVFLWCALSEHDSADLLDRPFTKDLKQSFLSLFTFQNFFGGGASGIISFIYLIGNVASSASSAQSSSANKSAIFSLPVFIVITIFLLSVFVILNIGKKFKLTKLLYLVPILPFAYEFAKLTPPKMLYYILFALFEYLIISLIISPAYGKSSLFFITFSSLAIIPFFKVGKSIDFCMRASIPLLVVLCLFALLSLKKYFKNYQNTLAVCLLIVLMLGAVTPLREIARTIEATSFEIAARGKVKNDVITEQRLFNAANFSGKKEDNLFFTHFAK